MRTLIFTAMILIAVAARGQETAYEIPIPVGIFEQQIHRSYTTKAGLPDNAVNRIEMNAAGQILAFTARGVAVFTGNEWQITAFANASRTELNAAQLARLRKRAGATLVIRDVAQYRNEFAVATDQGLFLGEGESWHLVFPQQGTRRWAPIDVRAAAYDTAGTLWFAAPQGVGFRKTENDWQLFTGADGLPFNDFTCIATSPKGVWFGTTNGAIQFRDGKWAFRQGRRWLLDNHVRDIAIDRAGNAWFATAAGVSCIFHQPMTLAEKAAFFEAELEKYHRRTRFGYVNPARLVVPGDKSTALPVYTNNDGQRMGFYLAAVSLGYAATGDLKMKENAANAFRALAFLSEVTQGGTHPAPSGFCARTVVPTTEPDPNPQYNLAFDLWRHERDSLWKIIQPRWPVDATGEWYWQNDGSADELDGHFLGYGTYFDRVCTTEAEKDAVRAVARRIIDHLIDHGYNIVDYDGTPTRWGRFSPDDLNRNEAWVSERGLRSFSILNYLSVAHHITGDAKYRKAYLELAFDHGYAMNGMTQPREIAGPGTFGQGDDKMAFMNYYHLLRYETDPKLLSMYYHAIRRHWRMESYEACPWANFIYAACCFGKVRRDHWGAIDLTPPKSNLEDAIETLKRYPLDLINWSISNTHRSDMLLLPEHLDQRPGTAGCRIDGRAFPIDERPELRWGGDPYLLAAEGDGTHLGKGVHYLFAYYLGRAHGFIRE